MVGGIVESPDEHLGFNPGGPVPQLIVCELAKARACIEAYQAPLAGC
jgi:hypothetical protein